MNNHNHNDEHVSWSNLLRGLIGSYVYRASGEIGQRVHEKVVRMERKSVGAALVLFGGIFLLAAIAILINTLTKNTLPWLGWGVVGIVIMIVGIITAKVK